VRSQQKKPVLLGLLFAGAALALMDSHAFACSPIGSPPPPGVNDAALAAYLMPFAEIAAFVEVDRMALLTPERRSAHPLPDEFSLAFDAIDLFAEEDRVALVMARLTGLRASAFLHCYGKLIVIAYSGMQIRDPRQYVAVAIRRLSDAPVLAVRFADLVVDRFLHLGVLLVGHSGGGGMAIYTGWARNIQTIAFNPVRPRSTAHIDNSEESINVIVRGDILADPTVMGGAEPPGRTLWLDPGDTPFLELHDLETIIRALEAL